MELKDIEFNMKIKNINELKTLIQEMKSIIDKIQNFKFDVEVKNEYSRSDKGKFKK